MLLFVRRKSSLVILLINTLILLSFAGGRVYAQSFTAGNLAILRLGDGVTGLTSSAQPLTVVEYTTSGVATGVTVPLPSSGAGPYATSSGSATSEGQMTMSAERDRLVVVGYNAPPGTANVSTSSSATYNRELFTINSGAITTNAASTTLYSGNNIRSGVASGTNYFGGGPVNGTSNLNTSTMLTAALVNTRVIQIFNGQTYLSSASGTNLGVLALGTNIPTTCCQTTTLLNSPNTGSAYGFSFSPDGNTLYIADDGLSGATAGISKYVKSGATYALAYVVSTTTSRSITVDYSGANPVIYATTATSTAPNAIIKITDVGAASPITTLVASSPANTVFRSLTFVPSCGASISLIGASTVCSGTNPRIVIKGNPTGAVAYNINGVATYTTTIGPNGFDTVSLGPITANTTVNLVSINTQACSSVPVTGSVTVNVFPAATFASIGTDGPLCAGFDLHLNAAITASASPYTYTWSGPAYSSGTISSALLTSSVTVTSIPALPANPVYTLTVTDGNSCAISTTVTTTVNPLPIAYTVFGSGSYCVGGTGIDVQLNNSQTGVNYQLYNTSGPVGSVMPGTTGSSVNFGNWPAGTYTVSASNTTTGCNNGMLGSAAITVNPLPAVITGSMTVCPGTTTALTDAGGGTWSSASPGNASIGSTGIVTGITGSTTAIITYTLPTTCYVTTTVNVNPLPLTITGGNAVCMGSSLALSDATGGGTWMSSNTGVATIGSGGGAVTPVSQGTTTISYVLPTGCMVNAVITVNPLPATITGTMNVCAGSNITLSDAGGGNWSSSNTGTATVGLLSGIVNGVAAGTTNITYTLPTTCMISTPITVNPLPTSILGNPSVCVGYTTSLSDLTTGGTWSSGAPGLATVGSSGLVTGLFTGTANISYTISSTGCYLFDNVTVNPLPVTISGPSTVCAGSVTTYTDVSSGGTWSSSNKGVANIGVGTGSLTAIMAGTTVITYTIGTGCTTSSVITVNPLPAAITGTMSVCQGLSTGLTDGTGGGTWSSSAAGFGTVDGAGNVTGISAGAFYISYTLPTTCFTTTSFTVNPLPGPINGPSNICAGASVGLTDAAGGGTWVSSSPSFVSINAASGFTSGIMGGTTVITYTLPTGCLVTKGLTVNPLPSAITGTGNVCVGSTVSLSDLTSGGAWSSSNTSYATVDGTTGVVTGTGAGIPYITYTFPSSCYTTFILTVNPLPLAVSGNLAICLGGTSSLSDSPTGGTWISNVPATADIGLSSGLVTTTAVGTATITYTSPAGCVNSAVVTVNPLPPAITGTLDVCPGTTTILTDVISGGTWSSVTPGIATVAVSGVVTGVAAGVATISYLPTTGCGTFAMVTVNPLPAAIAGNLAVCNGLTSALSDVATGGTWSSSTVGIASISPTGLVSGVSLGTATITYTLPTGCYITATVTVYPVPGLILGTATVCPGTTTSLSDLPAGGTWSSASPGIAIAGSASGIVTGVAAGTTNLTYTVAGGCTAVAVVTVNPLPALISGNVHACLGLTTSLSDAVGGGTWSSSSVTTASIDMVTGLVTGNAAGTATITYTLPTGCIRTTIVTVDTLPQPISLNTPVCVGSSIVLSDAGGGTWASGNLPVAAITFGGGTVIGIAAGTAIITYTLPSTCMITTIVTVNALPSPIAGASQVCGGLTITLTDATAGGSWISGNPAIATIGSATGVVTGVSAGNTPITYTASVTGCRATTTVSVIALPPAITGTAVVCATLSTVLNIAVSGGTWSSGASAIATIGSTGIVTGVSAGTANITYTATSGCFSTVVVTVNPLPNAISGTTAICYGLTTTLSDGSAGGTWLSGNTAVATIGTSGLVTSVSVGTANITYTLPTGCLTARTVSVNPLPGAISGALYLCVGADGTLTDGAAGGFWSIDAAASGIASVFGPTGDVSALSAGTATVTYTLPTGCTTTAVITVNPVPLAITGATNVCVGSSTTLTDATPAGTWSSSSTAQATITAGGGTTSGISQGVVVITYKLSTGCFTTTVFTVNPLPAAIAGNRSICLGTATTLSDASSGGTWSISHPDSIGIVSGIATGDSLGVDTVTYTLPTGCLITSVITVNPFPTSILGDTLGICQGYNILLSDSTPGGAWSSINPAVATINISGIVAGLAAGTANISYTLPTGCGVTAIVTVNPLFPISGNTSICLGVTDFLSDLATGGTWSSGSPLVATVSSATGAVSGVSSGAAYISYHLVTGCVAAIVVTVNDLPSLYVVTGGGSYCAGGAGVDIGLNGSDNGISYQLQYSGAAIDTLPGSGSALDFGLFTFAGGYTVLATDSITGCSATMTGSATVIVNPTVTPFVSIGASGGTTICVGTVADFTSVTVNGGSAPLYQWSVNGIPVGSGPDYSYVPLNGDVVSVLLISSAACATTDSATASVTMTTVNGIMPSVSLSVIPGDSLCPGTPVTVTPSTTTGGTSPTFEWVKNGINAGSGLTYTFLPIDGDNVFCWMHSSLTCALADTVHSDNNINMRVPPIYVPDVTIAAYPGTRIESGELVTLVASVTFSGLSFSYQWEINNTPVGGATTDTFRSSSFNNMDVVSCVITGTSLCGVASRAAQVLIVDTIATGIQGLQPSISDVKLVPNPNNGTFTIKGTIGTINDVSVVITDMVGQIVYKSSVPVNSGKINQEIRLGSIANGMYLLEITTGAVNKFLYFAVGQ